MKFVRIPDETFIFEDIVSELEKLYTVVAKCEGGVMCFETHEEYEIWENQK